MKQGRKKNSAYELYGFIPRVDSGKHSAICTSCNRVLKNTAATRLLRHRNSCLAGRAGETLPLSPAIENERRKKLNKICAAQEPEQQHQYQGRRQQHDATEDHEMESENEANSNVKIEQSNETFNHSTNENTYEEASDATAATDVQLSTTIKPRCSRQSEAVPLVTVSIGKSAYNNGDDFPTATTPPEPFELYQTATLPNAVDSEFEKENDDDLIDIEEELNVIKNLMPRSKESLHLQDELFKAETEYYNAKTQYFMKLTENTKIKRTLMLLQSRKLQLEIEKLTSEL